MEKEITGDMRQAFYFHYDDVVIRWSERQRLSPPPPAAVNSETFWDATPKLRAYRGRLLFDFDQRQGGQLPGAVVRTSRANAKRAVKRVPSLLMDLIQFTRPPVS